MDTMGQVIMHIACFTNLFQQLISQNSRRCFADVCDSGEKEQNHFSVNIHKTTC